MDHNLQFESYGLEMHMLDNNTETNLTDIRIGIIDYGNLSKPSSKYIPFSICHYTETNLTE